MRTTIRLSCPGSPSNYVVVVSTEWQSRYGLGNPANTGTCDLFIVPMDADEKPLQDGHLDVKLEPGESRSWYKPPPGTAKIAAVCSKSCNGSAVLEFDMPSA